MIRTVGAMVGAAPRAEALAAELEARIDTIRARSRGLPRPRVYFEEWDDPMISGIRWVSELIEVAGGEDCFPELGREPLGRDRIIADGTEVVRRDPEIIVGSWCGKKFRPERVSARPGFAGVTAVRAGELHEIKSAVILQPGPAALTDGIDALAAIVAAWRDRREANHR